MQLSIIGEGEENEDGRTYSRQKKIDAMKAILASGKYGQRNLVLFSIGINTAYRISDLRQLKLADVLEISRGRVVVKDRLAMKEQKQLNIIRSIFPTNCEKRFWSTFNRNFLINSFSKILTVICSLVEKGRMNRSTAKVCGESFMMLARQSD